MFCVKIRPGPLAVASCKNRKKTTVTRFWCAKSRMRRNDTPGRIVTNCCTGVGVHDVITCADLYDYRLRGLGVMGGQILGFSIDLHCRPYNTRTTVPLIQFIALIRRSMKSSRNISENVSMNFSGFSANSSS